MAGLSLHNKTRKTNKHYKDWKGEKADLSLFG